jgi:hypothetical protein
MIDKKIDKIVNYSKSLEEKREMLKAYIPPVLQEEIELNKPVTQTLTNAEGNKNKIFYRTLDGKIIDLFVTPMTGISEIKQKIEEIEGIKEEQQQLVFGTKILKSGVTIGDYGIPKHETLRLRTEEGLKGGVTKQPKFKWKRGNNVFEMKKCHISAWMRTNYTKSFIGLDRGKQGITTMIKGDGSTCLKFLEKIAIEYEKEEFSEINISGIKFKIEQSDQKNTGKGNINTYHVHPKKGGTGTLEYDLTLKEKWELEDAEKKIQIANLKPRDKTKIRKFNIAKIQKEFNKDANIKSVEDFLDRLSEKDWSIKTTLMEYIINYFSNKKLKGGYEKEEEEKILDQVKKIKASFDDKRGPYFFDNIEPYLKKIEPYLISIPEEDSFEIEENKPNKTEALNLLKQKLSEENKEKEDAFAYNNYTYIEDMIVKLAGDGDLKEENFKDVIKLIEDAAIYWNKKQSATKED